MEKLVHSYYILIQNLMPFYDFSPILGIASYQTAEYLDGSMVPVCLTQADTFWPAFYFITTISVFFIIPLAILIILYTIIAKNLMENPGIITQNNKHNIVSGNSVLRYRKQVVMMLGTVVLSFFVCLLPFKALTLWIVIVPQDTFLSLGMEGYYILLYFCRIMLYLNSAVNPILYNLMSSKFRDGFLRLLKLRKFKKLKRHKGDNIQRKDTFTTSTNYSSSQQTSDSFWRRYSSSKTVQKSPQKLNINGSTKKQTKEDKQHKISDIVNVQNNRRNSMRFVSDVILVPKEQILDNAARSANLEGYLEGETGTVHSGDKNGVERVVKDGIVIEGLISSGDKKTHFVRVPLLISKNLADSKNDISQYGKESFV